MRVIENHAHGVIYLQIRAVKTCCYAAHGSRDELLDCRFGNIPETI